MSCSKLRSCALPNLPVERIVETKSREDRDDPLKWERLKQCCADATAHYAEKRSFHALFVRDADGNIANFDFIVKRIDTEIWITDFLGTTQVAPGTHQFDAKPIM
jgi:hypothetical protein